MAAMHLPPRADESRPGPWFTERPRLAAAVVAVLFASIFALRLSVGGADEAISVLYVLPIALAAFTFGRRAGVAAGLTGVGLFGAWIWVTGESISVLGWLARATPMLLLGALVGSAADREREAAAVRRRLDAVELRQREAAEINDSIIQGMAVAKWSFEAGDPERGLDVLADTMTTAQDLVAQLLSAGSAGALRRRSAALHVKR